MNTPFYHHTPIIQYLFKAVLHQVSAIIVLFVHLSIPSLYMKFSLSSTRRGDKGDEVKEGEDYAAYYTKFL
jgi:hypothetical protein